MIGHDLRIMLALEILGCWLVAAESTPYPRRRLFYKATGIVRHDRILNGRSLSGRRN